MDKLKEQFKADFRKSKKPNLSFELNQLEPNTKKTKHEIKPSRAIAVVLASTMGAIICLPAVALLAMSLRIDDSVRYNNNNYSMNAIKIAESNTFRKLNDVTYPNGSAPKTNVITDAEESAYASFSNSTYHSLVDHSRQDNMSYSVVGLYSLMNELTNASSREDLTYHLNELLGLDISGRASFYEKVVGANSFAEQDSTIQLKNAAFFNNEFDYNRGYVSSLTRLYCEAYQLDFEKDASKIVDWVNAAVNSIGFVDKNYLGINEETQLYLFSTFYFKNAWRNKYLAEDTKEDVFHLSNGSTVKAKFMKHSYFSPYYCDYGSYISVRDYYHDGNASVTYLVPKKTEDNIFELTKDANIFEEKEDDKVYATKGGRHSSFDEFMVHLKTPKFKLKCDVDFRECLEGLGFESVFDRKIDSFKNAFSGDNLDNMNFYLQQVKQRNEVEFNEDGSVVKSVSMAVVGGVATAAPNEPTGTLEVDLNQPFIYIIKDVNDTPVFVGHVDNPNA